MGMYYHKKGAYTILGGRTEGYLYIWGRGSRERRETGGKYKKTKNESKKWLKQKRTSEGVERRCRFKLEKRGSLP